MCVYARCGEILSYKCDQSKVTPDRKCKETSWVFDLMTDVVWFMLNVYSFNQWIKHQNSLLGTLLQWYDTFPIGFVHLQWLSQECFAHRHDYDVSAWQSACIFNGHSIPVTWLTFAIFTVNLWQSQWGSKHEAASCGNVMLYLTTCRDLLNR